MNYRSLLRLTLQRCPGRCQCSLVRRNSLALRQPLWIVMSGRTPDARVRLSGRVDRFGADQGGCWCVSRSRGHCGYRWRTSRGRCSRSWRVTSRPPKRSVAMVCQHRRRRAKRPVYRVRQGRAGERAAGLAGAPIARSAVAPSSRHRESWAMLRRRVFQTCRPNGTGLSGRSDQMGSRGAGFCRVQEAMCFSKVLRTLSSRGSTSVACPTRVTLATLSPASLRSTLAKAICDP